ncbi:oocyte-secreted protein 3-like [Arvicanthis niloticus]|uniref:oocyte-secreted protein 3-like n=1 Tax=Arvicanthis niloticus TaxID=61156 RepID=UPI001487070D|nr:oocyte-secreted protein 3-like [Arvicanthis niloticus]
MKAFIASGLLLLIFGMWSCSGIEKVSMKCNYFKLLVRAKRALFYPNELVDPDELFLGPDCPVTSMRPDELEFYYDISSCGIFIEHAFDGTIVNTWLTYKPKNISFSAELQLQCVIRRHSYDEDPFKDSFYDIDLNCYLLPQCWYLILRRYCSICGHVHFLENWSRPFHGWRNDSFQRLFHPVFHHWLDTATQHLRI